MNITNEILNNYKSNCLKLKQVQIKSHRSQQIQNKIKREKEVGHEFGVDQRKQRGFKREIVEVEVVWCQKKRGGQRGSAMGIGQHERERERERVRFKRKEIGGGRGSTIVGGNGGEHIGGSTSL